MIKTVDITASFILNCKFRFMYYVYSHKLKFEKFHLNIRKNFFTQRVAEHCNRWPKEVMEFPSQETFRTHVCNLLEVTVP